MYYPPTWHSACLFKSKTELNYSKLTLQMYSWQITKVHFPEALLASKQFVYCQYTTQWNLWPFQCSFIFQTKCWEKFSCKWCSTENIMIKVLLFEKGNLAIAIKLFPQLCECDGGTKTFSMDCHLLGGISIHHLATPHASKYFYRFSQDLLSIRCHM